MRFDQFDPFEVLDAIASPIFVLEIVKAGDPVYSGWNKAAEDVSGLAAKDVLGKTVQQIFPGRLGRTANEKHKITAISGQTRTYEVTLPLPNGERNIRTTLKPLFNNEGQVTQLVGTTRDITNERNSSLTQVRTATHVETIASEMEQFITMAAHDLRTPMRNVQQLADLLREGFHDLGDGKLEIIDLLEEVGIKATSLISDVLAYARTTVADAEFETFNIADLVSDIASVIDPQDIHRVECRSACITADKPVIQVILRNLIDNAIKHSGKSRVSICIEVDDASAGQLAITIQDDGKGFRDPQVAFLAGGNFQYETGFGLLGIRRLVQARGGDIYAKRPVGGKGTFIQLSLPGTLTRKPSFAPATVQLIRDQAS